MFPQVSRGILKTPIPTTPRKKPKSAVTIREPPYDIEEYTDVEYDSDIRFGISLSQEYLFLFLLFFFPFV